MYVLQLVEYVWKLSAVKEAHLLNKFCANLQDALQ